jgi:ABC-type sugar transport system ATPase subunit
MTVAIQARGLAKAYGATRALRGVDLEVHRPVPCSDCLGRTGRASPHLPSVYF